jgi:hypothetical protein
MRVTSGVTSAITIPVHKFSTWNFTVERRKTGTHDAAFLDRNFPETGATMDNLNKGNFSDVGMTGGTTGTGTFTGDWNNDQQWWRDNFRNRPYVSADRGFDYYEPGYRFGYESANRYRGKNFNDVESNLRTDWDRFEGRGSSTWENVKDSVRDAWDNITGKR